MEESWLETAECLQLPSSFTTTTSRHHNPVTVLANGSRFLYLLDLKCKKLLTTVKFPCAVLHVSSAVFVEENVSSQGRSKSSPSVAVCCLGNGCVAAVPLEPCLASVSEGISTTDAERVDDIFTSLLEQPMESDPPRSDESASLPLSGDRMSVCISKVDSSLWTAMCAMVVEDKLAVCKKSKLSGEMCVTLFVSSDCTTFQQLLIPKFHGAPAVEFLLSKPAESASHSATVPSRLQYRPLFKLILPRESNLKDVHVDCECIEGELFHQLFRPDYHLSDGAVLLVCGSNGNILYSNLRSVSKNTARNRSSGDKILSSKSREMTFKSLYSLNQPVVSVHAVAFPKRPELIDPLLYCGEDNANLTSKTKTPNSLIFIGQRGKVALCFTNVIIHMSQTEKFPKFIEYNVPGPLLSFRLIPDQCLLYNTFQSLHRICLRQTCFEESEERAPQLQLQRGPLLIPEASFKFPERVAVSILPSVIVDCQLLGASSVGTEGVCEEVELTVAGLKGHLRALKVKVCSTESVSRDPGVVAKEVKQHLNSIQVTSEQVSVVSGKISKMNASLSELNHILTLMCTVKCQREGGAPVINGEVESPVECAVSAGFADQGISERVMCIDVSFSYNGKTTLGTGWSLVILVSTSPSSCDDLLPALHGNEGGVATPTTLSRSVPLEGLTTNGLVDERVFVASIFKRPLCFYVSCYLHYDFTNLLSALSSNSTHAPPSGGSTVSVLVCSKLLDALDFAQLSQELPLRRLHDPLTLATSCVRPNNHLPSSQLQDGPPHSLQLPIQDVSLSQLRTSQADVYRELSFLLLPHLEGAEEKFRSGSEISLTCYDGSSMRLKLLKQKEANSRREKATSYEDLELSLLLKSTSRSQLAEVARCVALRLRQRSDIDGSPLPIASCADSLTQEELYKREAELKEVSREAVKLLDQVTALGKFSGEPSATKKDELVSKTFSLYSKLRQLH